MRLKVTVIVENERGGEWPSEVRRSAENWAKNLVDKRLSGLGRATHPVTRRGQTYKAIIAEIKVEREDD